MRSLGNLAPQCRRTNPANEVAPLSNGSPDGHWIGLTHVSIGLDVRTATVVVAVICNGSSTQERTARVRNCFPATEITSEPRPVYSLPGFILSLGTVTLASFSSAEHRQPGRPGPAGHGALPGRAQRRIPLPH